MSEPLLKLNSDNTPMKLAQEALDRPAVCMFIPTENPGKQDTSMYVYWNPRQTSGCPTVPGHVTNLSNNTYLASPCSFCFLQANHQ